MKIENVVCGHLSVIKRLMVWCFCFEKGLSAKLKAKVKFKMKPDWKYGKRLKLKMSKRLIFPQQYGERKKPKLDITVSDHNFPLSQNAGPSKGTITK